MRRENTNNEQEISITQLKKRILDKTMEMKEHYPELYAYLDESPQLPLSEAVFLKVSDFKNYLNTVEAQLKRH